MPTVSVMVEGGKATASAPLGPALGPLGINIGAVVAEINKQTKDYAGMKVPVKVIVDSATKEFEIEIGSPPMSAVIKKEAGIEKGAADPKRESAANISIGQAIKIAKTKAASLSSYTLKSQVNEVLGTCDSMGIFVEGKKAKETIKDVKAGKYDSKFGGTDSGPVEKPAEPAEAPAEPKEAPAEEVKEEAPAEEKPAEQAEAKPEEKPAEEKKEEQKE